MLKLKSLILETKYISTVVGIIDSDGQIQSKLCKGNSHRNLGYYFGSKWRYNPQNKIVYWSTINHSDQTDEDMVNVENHLHKKYGYEVENQIDMNQQGGHKYINISHGIIDESTDEHPSTFDITNAKDNSALLKEEVSLDTLISFYKNKFSEMSLEGVAEFFINRENDSIYISCGIVHMDMILNAAKMTDDGHFIIPNSKKKKTYKQDKRSYKTDIDISDFIEDVEDVLKKSNIHATTVHIISTKNHTLNATIDNRRVKISIEVYMDDMITVTLQIKHATSLLSAQPTELVKLIDVFINQMIKTQKLLNQTTFKPDESGTLTEINISESILSEVPDVSLSGKKAIAGDKPLKTTTIAEVQNNIVIFRNRDPGFFAVGMTLIYFMDTEQAAEAIKKGEIPYLMVPRGTFYGGGNPITDIWKKRFQKPGTEHILGVLEGHSHESLIYVDMITVRPGWQRNSIASKMIEALKSLFPNAELKTSATTDKGEKFLKSYKKSHNINEAKYTDGMSDDEQQERAERYFSIGQEENHENNFCWIWDKDTQAIDARKGQTHSHHFGFGKKDYTFSGWYDVEKNAISIVFPDSELRKLSGRAPTEEDIPQQVYQKLINKFGKRKPTFVIFESLKPDLKSMIVEMVKDVLMEGETIYGWWIDDQGKPFVVEYQDHRDWGIDYLKKHGEKEPHITVYKKMYALGFIRAIKEEHGIYYEYELSRPPNSQQIKEMKDLAIENGCKYIFDDMIKKWSAIDEERFMNENMTYKELLDLTTPERKERSANVRVRSIPVNVENGQQQWRFRYKSSPTTTVTNKPFEGHITFFKEDIRPNEDAMNLDCKVDCGCPDYMYKFAYNNMNQDAGAIGKDSLNKCANRSPQPAYDIGEGLCKHLAALRGYLQTKIAATKKSNLFEALNEVSNQGPFNIEYPD